MRQPSPRRHRYYGRHADVFVMEIISTREHTHPGKAHCGDQKYMCNNSRESPLTAVEASDKLEYFGLWKILKQQRERYHHQAIEMTVLMNEDLHKIRDIYIIDSKTLRVKHRPVYRSVRNSSAEYSGGHKLIRSREPTLSVYAPSLMSGSKSFESRSLVSTNVWPWRWNHISGHKLCRASLLPLWCTITGTRSIHRWVYNFKLLLS